MTQAPPSPTDRPDADAPDPQPARPRQAVSRLAGAVGGLVAAAFALGVGELVAGVEDDFASPVEAVASAVIDRAPRPVERFAIETFGANDKLALVIGTVVLSGVLGAGLGIVARRRFRLAALGFAAFAVLGALATAVARGTPSGPAAVVPSLAAGLAGVAALRLLVPGPAPSPGPLPSHSGGPGDDHADHDDHDGGRERVPRAIDRGGMASRRMFLATSALVAAGAAAAGAGGRALRARFSAAESRAAVRLPGADRPLAPLTSATDVGVDGVTPFVTPNRDFYRVDTALIVPQVRAEDWRLRIHGMVDEVVELTFDQLLDRELVEADITLTCISNQVGGDLVGNARWLGVLARDLLDEAGVGSRADQLVGRSTDGYTCGFPIDHAYDRNCLVAVGMNGEPLPLRHGFPARLVTPGIYGYTGSTKWLTELEVTTFDAFDQYWVPRGYAAQAPIKTMARIDTPRSLARVAPGRVTVAGVAWAQTRGIEAVEVRIDDGRFTPAVLADAPGRDTWRQWRFDWDATPGRHDITVRAADGTGETQTEERADVLPDGASGWMSLAVTVSEGA